MSQLASGIFIECVSVVFVPTKKKYDLCFCSNENVKWHATVCPKTGEILVFFLAFIFHFFFATAAADNKQNYDAS